jgi:hypothetical protein
MDDKITIIEGPPPVFELAQDGWALGVHEGPNQSALVFTRLRAFNSAALVERCYNAWRNKGTMRLEYRSLDGLQQQTPIIAARAIEVEEGPMLLLWLRIPAQDAELEIGFDDDSEET